MKDITKYSDEELEQESKVAFSEYYRLATVIRPAPPTAKDLIPLQRATERYEAIGEEQLRRLNLRNA